MIKPLTLCLLIALSSISVSAQTQPNSVPGGVYSWPIPAAASDIRFRGNPVLQIADTALIGIPMSQEVGAAQISYMLDGVKHQHSFQVAAKTYSEQHLEIANKAMVDPPAETLARIREESTRQRRLYRSFAETPDLSHGFMKPLEGITTSLFGHRRFFNGQPRSPHSGLDIAADTGAPVVAAAAAKVTLADELYFNGNTVFLDHGQGLITMYCHLSELDVAEGDSVAQGQIIGLVGATGRVTGPHLHWSVSLGGSRIDPSVFMQTLNALTQPTPDAPLPVAEKAVSEKGP